MRLLSKTGKNHEALRQYRLCVRNLERELGVTPSPGTVALYEEIRQQHAQKFPVISPGERMATRVTPPYLLTSEVQEKPVVFVGKEAALAELDGHLQQALAGNGQVVFVVGGPGRGKTHLLQEFARRAMQKHEQLLVANGTCNEFTGAGDPYLPFKEILGLLTGEIEKDWSGERLMPLQARRLWEYTSQAIQSLVECGDILVNILIPGEALLTRAQATGVMPNQQFKALETLAAAKGVIGAQQTAVLEGYANFLQMLSQQNPVVLILDDLQWVDQGSSNMLFHLTRRLAGSRVLILGAYRPEEVQLGRQGEQHPLNVVVGELKRQFGDIWIDLSQTSEHENRSFVEAYLDTEANKLDVDFREALYQQTLGHPLFTVELLRDMQIRGALVQDTDGDWRPGAALDWEHIPDRVEAAIAFRVDRLDEMQRSLLEVASVEGYQFTAQVVGKVEGVAGRKLIKTLDRDCAECHRLIIDIGDAQINAQSVSRYQFRHPLFQEYLYQSLSDGEKRLLHAEVGAALEMLYANQVESIVVNLAQHFENAEMPERAIPYMLKAGEQARLAYAHDEAEDYFLRVRDLLSNVAGSDKHKYWRFQALFGLGKIYNESVRLNKVVEPLSEAIVLGKKLNLPPEEMVRIYYWLGEGYYGLGEHEKRIQLGEEGLALLGDERETTGIAIMNQLIYIGEAILGNHERSSEFVCRTESFLENLPYCEELLTAFLHVIEFHLGKNNAVMVEKWLEIMKAKAEEQRDIRGIGGYFTHYAMLSELRGDPTQAIWMAEEALKLNKRLGHLMHQSWACRILARNHHVLGNQQLAENFATQAEDVVRLSGAKNTDSSLNFELIADILLSKGDIEAAIQAYQTALNESKRPRIDWRYYFHMGWAYFHQGLADIALSHFVHALENIIPSSSLDPGDLFGILAGVETVIQDRQVFRKFVSRQEQSAWQAAIDPQVQICLEPVEETSHFQAHDQQADWLPTIPLDWNWVDPSGDCTYTLDHHLTILAANARDLLTLNLTAPRLTRPTWGDFRVQTLTAPAFADRPTVGGLLIWKDEESYLCLERGRWGAEEISYRGCVDNQNLNFGRGRLPFGRSAEIYLRLERSGDQVKAYCSPDGEEWFRVGDATFPVRDPLQVGLHAIGAIPRFVYLCTFREGTAIRFNSVELPHG